MSCVALLILAIAIHDGGRSTMIDALIVSFMDSLINASVGPLIVFVDSFVD